MAAHRDGHHTSDSFSTNSSSATYTEGRRNSRFPRRCRGPGDSLLADGASAPGISQDEVMQAGEALLCDPDSLV